MTVNKAQDSNSIDLEKLFYKQNIDLEGLIKNKASSRKKITSYSLETYQGDFGYIQKKHLLNRALIGRSNKDLSNLEGFDLDQAIDQIFKKEDLPSEPTYDFFYINGGSKEEIINYQIEKGVPERYSKWVNEGESYANINITLQPGKASFSMRAWLLRQFATQSTSIHWKICFFLYQLIPVHDGAVGGAKWLHEYYMKLFKYSYGNYKDLIREVTTDFGMLRYLNLTLSKKENPDENYARELLELYTVGKEGGAKFSESDVKEISKLLTGWHTGSDSWLYFERQGFSESEQFDGYFADGPLFSWFDPQNHDASDKQLSSYFDDKVIQGREGEEGKKELDDLLTIIFENQDTSKYIARRIYQFFVNPLVDNEIEEKIIIPLSQVFKNSNFNVAETVKVLLKSEHFFDPINYNSIIKSPLEFYLSIFKELHLKYVQNPTAYEPGGGGFQIHYALANPLSKDYFIYYHLNGYLEQSGLNFTFPPSVSGWKPYYQKPIYDMFWINTYTIKKRGEIDLLVGQFHVYLHGLGGGDGSDVIQCDLYDYISSIKNFKNINPFIEGLTKRFLNSDVDTETFNILKESILDGKSESYWTSLIEDYERTRNKPEYDTLKNRIRGVLLKIFQLEEMHTY
ncbi:DUF1800 domain-containing protein [Flavobacteriaceae bacterium]|nr:DUF1800 domain-containing protein [Flavobacteriaceae bacterium]